MSERRDLLAISELLGTSNLLDGQNKTNVELLTSILNKLKQIDQSKGELLAHNTLPDSLAFPSKDNVDDNLAESTGQWDQLKKSNDLLKQDYTCRRQMLLNRLDCTVESFKWKASDLKTKTDGNEQLPTLNDMIHEEYDQARKGLRAEPQVDMSRLLAVRSDECDKLLNCVVSTSGVDSKINYKPPQLSHKNRQDGDTKLVNLKQIIIPDVPDRGGRTDEIRAPPKETFGQQYKSRGRGRGGGGRR